LSIPHWAHHFTAIISKVHEFVQNRVSSPTSARFLIAALGTPLLSDFQQRARVWRRSARFVILAPGTPLFSKVHEFVENSVFSPRPGRFAIFALGAPLFSDF